MGKNIILFLSILISISNLASYDKTEPPLSEEKSLITLKLEDKSCADEWITLTTTMIK